MSALVPAGVYGLRVPAGGMPVLGTQNPGLSFRITMAAIDPTSEPADDLPHRATLKIIRERMDDEDEDDDSDYDEDDVEGIRAKLREAGVLGSDDDSDMSEDDSEEETNGGPSDPVKSKQAKREALEKKLKEDAEEMEIDSIANGVNGKSKGKARALNGDDEISSEEDDEDSESDDEVQELVLCTLNPETHTQQALEITVREGEEVYFVSVGGYDIFLTGNYVVVQDDEDDESDEDDEYGLGYGAEEDDFSEDFSDSEQDELDDLEDPRITEVDSEEEEEAPKLVKTDKKGKKRPAEEDEDATLDDLISKTKADASATNGEKLSKKQAKKLKNNEGQAVAAAAADSKKESKDKAEAPGSDKK